MICPGRREGKGVQRFGCAYRRAWGGVRFRGQSDGEALLDYPEFPRIIIAFAWLGADVCIVEKGI